MVKNNGCGHGKVTREMVNGIKEDISEMKTDLKNVSNHYSNRLPTWASVVITFMGIAIGGLLSRLW